MALIESIIQPILDKLWSQLRIVFKPFDKLIGIVTRFFHNATHLFENVRTLVELVISEVNAWKNFKENLAFRTKVMNVKSAIEHTQDFISEVRSGWDAITELIRTFKDQLPTEDPALEAKEAIEDIEGSGFKGIFEKFPKLLRGMEKLLGFVAVLAQALEAIITTVDDLTRIVQATQAIREEVEEGKSLFLSQGNRRKTVTLDDGTKMKIRVGNLH